MNVDRAEEILQSKERFEVEWNGKSIWIDSIDSGSQTAQVHTVIDPADAKTVAVAELREVH